MIRIYKAVIIGCGRIGSEYDFSHAGMYSSNKQTKLIAVCDTNIEKAKKAQRKWRVKTSYGNYKTMLTKEKPDIVSVCTWEDSHAEIIDECVKWHPMAIICEKPLADTISNAKKIISACKKNKVILQINYQRRFNKTYQEIRDFIWKGWLGKIQKITGHYGNGLMTNGSHLIDLAHYFLQEDFGKVMAFKSKIKSAYEHDDNYAVIAETKSGAIFSLTPSDNRKYLQLELEIFGENGKISFKQNGYEIEYEKPCKHKIFPAFKGLAKATLPFRSKPDGKFMESALAELLLCIEQRKTPLCTGEDALKTLEFIQKCIKK